MAGELSSRPGTWWAANWKMTPRPSRKSSRFFSQLYSANLLEADVTPDAAVLLRRHKKMVERKLQGRLMNVLFPRIPLWDPDTFLQRWMPVMRVLFSWLGAVSGWRW